VQSCKSKKRLADFFSGPDRLPFKCLQIKMSGLAESIPGSIRYYMDSGDERKTFFRQFDEHYKFISITARRARPSS